MHSLAPVYTAELFPPLHEALLTLLRGLTTADWQRPTVAGEWRVRDVAAHLLDGDLRKLSAYRDGHTPKPDRPIEGHAELVRFLNGLNATWIDASRRLSSQVIVDLLAATGPAVAELMATLPPHEPSLFPVTWATSDASENWLDIGREYTERWHHQMQIRDAVGAPALTERRWLEPLLDLSMRAVPFAYAGTIAPMDTAVVIALAGNALSVWSLVCGDGGWTILRGAASSPAATVTLDPDTAWRVLYNALSADEARKRARIEGDGDLAAPFFRARSVMV